MLQIVMAVFGMVISAGIGLLIYANVSMASNAIDQVEDLRMLDQAAVALEAKITAVPGTSEVGLPLGTFVDGPNWDTLPAGIGNGSYTIDGRPFLYCPVGRVSAGQRSTMASTTAAEIRMPGTSYNATIYNGLVVGSDLAIDGAVEAALKPLAFLIAPAANASSPPDCSDVRMEGQKAVADGGYVRVISYPEGTFNTKHAAGAFYVASNASGSGKSSGDPASIDDAIYYFARVKPSSFTVIVSGAVASSSGAFAALISAADANPSAALTFRGVNSASITVSGQPLWNLPPTTVFENISFVGPRFAIQPAGKLTLTGAVGITPGQTGVPAITVNPGSELRVVNASLGIDTAGSTSISVLGKIYASNASITAISAQPHTLIYLRYGRGEFYGSVIGSPSIRPSYSPIRGSVYSEIVSDSSSRTYRSSISNCWISTEGDLAFAWSPNAAGQTSAVYPESNYAAPAYSAGLAAKTTYENDRAKRLRARRQNISQLGCA